jgi:hypothetical protein
MSSERPTPINDDHGDQFPGALPARTASAPSPGVEDRLVRMHAAYVEKVNSVVQAGRDDLAHELAETFDEESSGTHSPGGHINLARSRRAAGRGAPNRSRNGRAPGQSATRVGRFTRRSLERFDRYTLDVFNPGSPYRSRDDR